MNHPDFVLWMLLFPVVVAICDGGDEPSAGAVIFVLGIWFYVGYLLY